MRDTTSTTPHRSATAEATPAPTGAASWSDPIRLHRTEATPVAENRTATPANLRHPARSQQEAMREDWHGGMRQVDIAAKYGCSQALVSRLIGTTPRAKGEPGYAELRARCLLALALINHRVTPDGLTAADIEAVQGALTGQWDQAVA
jgi:hypothetical protein